ncbi:MAG: hypothetical protein ACJ8GN_21930 [Longimicrobiaceae bacterium]
MALALAAALGACGRESPRDASPASASVSCPSRPGGSRWASAGGRYREAATYGHTPDRWLYEAGGVVYSDSLLYVYDVPETRIVVLTAGLEPVRSFARKGNGPGELFPSIAMGMKGAGWRWLDVSGDTVAVFDGIRLQLFSRSGRFLEQRLSGLVGTPALSGGAERIAFSGGTAVVSSGGYDAPALQRPGDRYRWDLTAHTPRSSRRLLSLKLAPLPARGRSATFNGPEQARPLWDLSRGCVAATDGTGEWLVRASLAGGRVDTTALRLPPVKPPRIDRDEYARMIRMASKGEHGYLAPTAIRKLSGLVIDPDGYAWLLPTQDSTNVPDGGVEVVRIALSTGAAERDTVPAFPAAFGAPGTFYARKNDRHTGEAVVIRYDRALSSTRR